MKQADEPRIHVAEVIGDVEHGDPFASEQVTEFSIQAGAVGFFHDQNDIGPLDLLVAERHLCVVVEPSGIHLDARVIRKHGFGRGTSQPVLRADE